MRGIARIRGVAAQRVRRWDVLMLGAALPGLVAAIRLGQRGARVMVLEEETAATAPTLLREPFLLTGAEPSGILGSCLRTLGVPLIDQRRFAPTDVAVQVVLPDARVDVGRAALTAAELTAWGLAKPDEARALVRALEQAAGAELAAMRLDAGGGRRRRGRPAETGGAPAQGLARGWPREASEVEAPLRGLLATLTRALSNLGERPPSPEAHARLIGGLLEGGFVLGGGEAGLLPMLRRRARALFAEFRSLDRPFELVSVANQPAIALEEPDEIVSGRVMVLNAPLAGLRRALRGGEVPEVLRSPEPTRRRVLRHLHGPTELLPEGMEARLVCVPPTAGGDAPAVSLRRQPGERPGRVDLVASAVAPLDAPAAGVQDWIDRVIERLVPFADGRFTARPVATPVWDTDDLLCDPSGGSGWPAPFTSRLAGRLPVHHLDRAAVAGLGFEGDLLLGLHAAEAIAAELP